MMTPTRAKRNSRAPERFSSDETKFDTANGTSNMNQNDSSSSSAKIKLKPLIREPLKVKLPRLKRLQPMQSYIQHKESAKTTKKESTGLTTKIKLPGKKRIVDLSKTKNDSLLTQPTQEQFSNSQLNYDKTCDLNSSSAPKVDQADLNRVVSQKLEESSMIDTNQTMGETDASADSETSEIAGMKIVVEHKSDSSSDIHCPCGVDDDLGFMLECEKCLTWQHGHCVNVGPEEDAYEGYMCAYCTLPSGQHAESLLNLVVGDKFQSKFEALEKFVKLKSESAGNCLDIDENPPDFSLDDLEAAMSDLNRVSKSLRVKWRILISEDYNAELKIWKNPIWFDDPQENSKQKQQPVCFVGDIYKGNLKLNICNMLNKMHKRCQLMRYHIQCIEKQEQDSQQRLEKLLACLDDISRVVEECSESLKQN